MKFYSYEDKLSTDGVRIYCKEKILLRETPCGYWISYNETEYLKKWVSKKGLRRKWCPTKEEALKNFLARKKRQIKILEGRLNQARKALSIGQIVEESLK
ncbi:MAG: hypothetical protein ACOC33_00570 [bacterium]